MRNRYYCLFILFLTLLCFAKGISAYDNIITHPDITEKAAAENSQLDQYLKNYLGLIDGINTPFPPDNPETTVLYWLRHGSDFEDVPDCRASNHFHDPLKDWNQSFMSDDTTFLGARIRNQCDSEGWTYSFRSSNITWATGYLAPPPGGAKESFRAFPPWAPINWDTAREYFYDALTSLSKTERDAKFAATFSALGHVMHLLEDVSVPAHVRNDFTSHLTFNGLLEALLERNIKKLVKQPYEYYVQKNPNLVRTIAVQTGDFPSFNNIKLTDFWDTNQYNGGVPLTDSSIGLSEFTNANYFSDSTIRTNTDLTPEHTYPNPVINSDNYQVCTESPSYIPITRKRWYISRKDKQGCDHFAVVSALNPLTYFTNPTYLDSNISSLKLFLDDNVHNTYAKDLLPRAVGYSAKLLDYFFRGMLEFILPEKIINTNGETTGIRMKIKNSTQGESLERYIDPDTGLNKSKFIVSYQYELQGDTNIHYGLSNEIDLIQAIASGSESTSEYAFTFVNLIPSNAMSVKYYLVYRGKLGSEVDSVIGKVYYENLGITAPDSYVYSITDGSQTPYVDIYGHSHQQFTKMKAKVMITDITGHIQSGNIQAKVRYKKRTDYQWDLSADPPTEAAREANFSYSTSTIATLTPEYITALDNLELRQFTFDFTNDPIPAGITDLFLEITIKGIMQGKTTEETIAFGSKDLMEPAHHVIWNLTDMFSLDYHIYTSYDNPYTPEVDGIRNTPSLANRVDLDDDGIFNEVSDGEPYIDPFPITFDIGYMNQSPPIEPVYTSATVVLPAGRHIRLAVLVDYPAYIRIGWLSDIYPPYDYADMWFTGVINQVVNGQWQSTPVSSFRYGLDGVTEEPVRQHLVQGVITCSPYVGGCSYPLEEAISAELTPYEATILFPEGGLMQQQGPVYSQSAPESQSGASGIVIVE